MEFQSSPIGSHGTNGILPTFLPLKNQPSMDPSCFVFLSWEQNAVWNHSNFGAVFLAKLT